MKVAIACAAVLASATGSLVAIPQAVAQQGGANKLPAYRINPGDEIEVYVWGEERLQRGIRVLPDGSFSFPLVGRVEAAGKLPSDIETAITKGLSAQFRDQVARRLDGSLSDDEFKPLRLKNGLYLQLHAYMLRVAVPYGTISSKQLRQLAHIAHADEQPAPLS